MTAVESCDLAKITGIGIAAVFREEDRETIAGEILHLLIPAGEGVGRRIAPRIVIEGEEIRALVVRTTVHVFSHLQSILRNICGRVTNWDCSVASVADVLSHITGDGLDVRSSCRARGIVDDLVAGKEGESIAVTLEGIDRGKDTLEVNIVVGWARICSVQGIEGGVDVENEVDASICQGVHASVMRRSVVDGVYSNSVDAQLLKLSNISCAAGGIGDGICQIGGTTRLVVDATDVESVVSSEESYPIISRLLEDAEDAFYVPFPFTLTEVVLLLTDAAEATPAPRARRVEVRMMMVK